jgi:hypothetical protein
MVSEILERIQLSLKVRPIYKLHAGQQDNNDAVLGPVHPQLQHNVHAVGLGHSNYRYNCPQNRLALTLIKENLINPKEKGGLRQERTQTQKQN